MNKKDLLPVILLALLIPVWIMIDRALIAPKYSTPEPIPAAAEQPEETTERKPAASENTADFIEEQAAIPVLEETIEPQAEEIIEVLSNDSLELELSSFGGGIRSATLIARNDDGQILYPEQNNEESPPEALAFTDLPALTYEGLTGITAEDPLSVRRTDDGSGVIFSKSWKGGMAFERTIRMQEDYVLEIQDRFINRGDNAWNIPAVRILTGSMGNPKDTASMRGVSMLGVDSCTPDGEIFYWGRKLNKLYKNADKPLAIDRVPEDMRGIEVDWASTKNKFFTQILSPENPADSMAVLSTRDPAEKGIVPQSIGAALQFQPTVVEAGTTLPMNYTYYIGPKKYSELKAAGNYFEGVMEFETTGFWSFMNWLMQPARKGLLWSLNFFDGIVGNYGVAIILLTLLVRILFWPLTHKSTDKMRENSEKMQVVQPKIKALQEKYKGNPQKIQQETVKIYQEHNFNPMGMMGGCLPLMLQMPVFIALFTVLRNAIELRYSGFLWISDLSSPENLLAGSIPFVGSLNILPLLMSASMVFQQKMTTPNTAATPEQQQQQKMMLVMMPLMMLFFFYSMPSGLVLYFTTSNTLMIAQTGIRNLRKKVKKA